jgi:hypothetical protein
MDEPPNLMLWAQMRQDVYAARRRLWREAHPLAKVADTTTFLDADAIKGRPLILVEDDAPSADTVKE